MSKGLEVFQVSPDAIKFVMGKAKEVLEEKLNPKWVKQRTQGKTTLSYIGGHTVIRLLNKAFNYQWSFEIVSEEIVQSIPKFNKYAKEGQEKFEDQPPVAKVLGRLTVPGLGVKEQYGSKVLIGGASEQESAFKSASTDALKKCASLFGIGLELYGDDEGLVDAEEYSQPAPQQKPVTQQQKPVTQPTTNQSGATQQQASTQANTGEWVQADINRLKDLKSILGITDNYQLDPYVREFFDNKEVTFANITPENIKAVNIFLAKKAEAQ